MNSALACAHYALADPAGRDALLDETVRAGKNLPAEYPLRYQIWVAEPYACSGNRGQATEWLERAFASRSGDFRDLLHVRWISLAATRGS